MDKTISLHLWHIMLRHFHQKRYISRVKSPKCYFILLAYTETCLEKIFVYENNTQAKPYKLLILHAHLCTCTHTNIVPLFHFNSHKILHIHS